MANLDNARVDLLYEKLTGQKPTRGNWNVERRNFAQKIVYIDEACKAVLDAISAIESSGPDSDVKKLEADLRTEFRFLNTLQE